MSGEWMPISTAPKDGTRFLGRGPIANPLRGRIRTVKRRTFWGKTSHVPLYGWNYGRDVENLNLWEPSEWRPLKARRTLHLTQPRGDVA